METDPVEILNRRNAEVAQIRGFADLTEEAKERRIAEVSERAQAEYAEAREAAERERAERTERAVFRVPIPAGTTDAEAAQIHAAFRAAWGDVYSSTATTDGPEQAGEELERILQQAERTGDKLLARAAYHRAIDLGVQGVVDAYLSSRPSENRAWESYTAAYREVSEARGIGHILERGFAERALSSDQTSGIGG